MSEMNSDPVAEQPPVDLVVESEKKKPRLVWLVVAVLGVALLGAAAFIGARLLSPQSGTGAGGMIEIGGGNGMSVAYSGTSARMEPAKEIPQREADVNGMVAKIKDRSLFVRTGDGIMMTIGDDGAATTNMVDEGAPVEVVVTSETGIYQDVTFESKALPEEGTVQQVVEALTLSDIGKDAFVTVWGTKRGDRLIADVILCNPAISIAPAK